MHSSFFAPYRHAVAHLVLGISLALMGAIAQATDEADQARIRELLKGFDRPTVDQIRSIPLSAWETVLGPVERPSAKERNVFALYHALIQEVRASFPDYEILIYGRDGEWLNDAFRATATPRQLRKIHLIQASRGLVKNSEIPDILAFLQRHGMQLDEIYAGRQKVLWLDTGSRGKIFNRLFGILVSQVREDDPLRHAKLLNLFENIEGRMIVALGQPSKNQVLHYIKSQFRSNEAIADMVRERLFYPHLPSSDRAQFGLGETFDLEYPWLVDNIEHTPKWRARTRLVDAKGVVHLEEDPKDQGDINPLRHLEMQVRLVRWFLSDRPWLAATEAEGSAEPQELATETRAPHAVLSPAELFARFEDLLQERSDTEDSDRKAAIGEEIGRLLRNEDLQSLVLRHRLSSDRLAHLVRRSVADFPPVFLKRYADAVRSMSRPSDKQERALLKCEQQLAKLGNLQ